MNANTGNALTVLFNHAKDQLPDEKLKWLASLDESASEQVFSVSESLGGMAAALSAEDSTHKPSNDQVVSMLWALQEALESAHGALSVSDDARQELAERAKVREGRQ